MASPLTGQAAETNHSFRKASPGSHIDSALVNLPKKYDIFRVPASAVIAVIPGIWNAAEALVLRNFLLLAIFWQNNSK
ncbi:hypothetical protein HA49_19815 [Tatumella morbirosei]|uniref:Uncharacterized protein n=1 Tax=Tatumella morbirosei TaxID=642227 RepID=A0A095T1T0_9GAMM|nr:hypothetical protein HA49_19815 [Tatumella morbirosei]